jgi:CheY-like chemotaxis protein
MAAPRRVLVVDDDQDVLTLVSEVLTDEGLSVRTARNGMDALAIAASWSPDLILLDIQMPIMDGWEFVRTYRQSPGPHAPIIVLTGGRGGAAYAREAGAQGSLPKPFSLSRLLAVVDEQTSRASSAA